ncbi:FAD:protein FMN transferase [Hymenobacter terrenus]|uniref:FAD:protein FMN transferase n=1 Tax=Hymenobacter terrenus TaxID=1629124 RepID=UPI000619AC34|nr:FAD:protein FMN transferase [Hymenobacter terrenus]
MRQSQKVKVRLMGSDFELIAVDEHAERGQKHLQAAIAEIRRIEALLTEFSETSQTAHINREAGIRPVAVDAELFELIERCLLLSQISQGAFDVSAGALKPLYDFKRGRAGFPTAALLNTVRQRVGYQHIELLSGNRVFLRKKGMRIGFGAIGKGYAADRAKALLEARGVKNGVVNASGDLTAWGTQADGSAWRIGIADPAKPEQVILWLPIQNLSVATSGNYEQFFEHNGVRYAHTLDPRSGLPTRYLKSVTVISAKAELSDALATVVTVTGAEVGLHLINQMPHTHCVLIDDQNEVFTSKHLTVQANE